MARLAEQRRVWTHRLKRGVIERPGLRHRIRRWILAPYQLWQLARVVGRLKAAGADAGAGGEEQGPKVVVLAFRHWAISRAWETVFSRLLTRLGCRVTWVTDDRVMLRCDSMAGAHRDLALCTHCVAFNRRAAAVAGVERRSLADFLTADEAAAVSEELVWGNRFDERYREVLASFQRLLAARPAPVAELPPAERRILAELLLSAERVRRATERLLDTLQPDAVLALNGKFFAEAIVLAAAQRGGIPVWTYERGNRRDTVVLAPTATAVPFHTADLLASLDEPLTAAQGAAADQYLQRRQEVGNGQVRFLAAGARALDLPAARSRLALFTNLIWDSAVVGEDTVFPDMFDWVVATVRAVAATPDQHLVIRVHPAEVRVYWHPTRQRVAEALAAAFPDGLPANVTLVDAEDPVDSYALVRRSDLVLVYSSTVGLEAAALGRRVVVAARSNYSAAPFVVRPASRAEYLAEIGSEETATPPRAAELARRFIYRLYFESMLPVPAVREDPTGFHAGPAGTGSAPVDGVGVEPTLLERRLGDLAAAAARHAVPDAGRT